MTYITEILYRWTLYIVSRGESVWLLGYRLEVRGTGAEAQQGLGPTQLPAEWLRP
jgi:hypothetical protein